MPADPPPARLLIKVGPLRGAAFDLAGEATIGRHPASSVVLGSPAVSARHARIGWEPEAGGYVLEDLGSRNGTALDGVPVAGRERLGRLHVITAGDVDLIFQGPELLAGPRAPAAGGGQAEGTRVEEAPVPLPSALAEETRSEHDLPPIPAALADRPGGAAEPGGTIIAQELPSLPAALAEETGDRGADDGTPAEPDRGGADDGDSGDRR